MIRLQKWFLLLCFILLVAFVARFVGLSSEPLWLDEAISIQQTQAGSYDEMMTLVKEDVHLPLYQTLLYCWVTVFGTSEFSVRFLSLLFGVGGVLLLYLVGELLFSRKVAMIAAALLAFSQIHIVYSQEARLYSLFLFLTLASVYTFWQLLHNPTNKSIVWYTIITALLIYTHLFAFLVLFFQNVFVLYMNRLAYKKYIPWFSTQFILFVLFIPWIPILLTQISRTKNVMWLSPIHPELLFEAAMSIIGSRGAFVVLVVLVLLVSIISFVFKKRNTFKISFSKLFQEKNQKLIFLLLWFLSPFAIVILYSLVASPLFHIRYLLFTLPAFLLLLAFFFQKLFEDKSIFIRRLGLVAFVLFIVLSFATIVQLAVAVEKDDWRSVDEYVRANIGDDEILFMSPFYQVTPYAYYASPDCFPREDILKCLFESESIVTVQWNATCCVANTTLAIDERKMTLSTFTNESLWVVSVREELYGTSLTNYFTDHMTVELQTQIGDVLITKFEPRVS